MNPVFLLDTNVISTLRKTRPHPRLVAWLRSVPRDAVFMSSVTIAEIACGIGQVDDPVVAQRVQEWLDGLLRDGHPQIAAFDAQAYPVQNVLTAEGFVQVLDNDNGRSAGLTCFLLRRNLIDCVHICFVIVSAIFRGRI